MKVRLLKILDATAGACFCWLGGLLLHLARSGGTVAGRPARRILVIRPGGMGDMILLQPMLKTLMRHEPEATIDLVCENRNRAIPAMAGVTVNTLLYDARPLRTVLTLLRRRYDIAIDTEQFHHFSAVMAWLSGAPVRVGFKINPGRNPIYTHLVNYTLEGYEADEFMRLLHPLGIREEAVVAGCLARAARPPAPSTLLIHAGASTRYKRWAPEHFAAMAQQLLAPSPGSSPGTPIPNRSLILVGDRHDAPLARRIAGLAGLGDRLSVKAGALSLEETATVISQAALFIGGDSGLAHLAVALGTPTVILFGPSDPMKWAARGPGHTVVRKDLACSPCFIFGYHKPCHTIACMTGITVAEVVAAATKPFPAS